MGGEKIRAPGHLSGVVYSTWSMTQLSKSERQVSCILVMVADGRPDCSNDTLDFSVHVEQRCCPMCCGLTIQVHCGGDGDEHALCRYYFVLFFFGRIFKMNLSKTIALSPTLSLSSLSPLSLTHTHTQVEGNVHV